MSGPRVTPFPIGSKLGGKITERADPLAAGWDARMRGRPQDRCPFTRQPDLAREWLSGWLDADSVEQRRASR